jgi:hypothetical protein
VNARIALLVLVVGATLVGCRPRGIESFVSATTPQENTGKYKGDEYSSGGIGDANGGRIITSTRDKGAKKGAGAVMDTVHDAPMKGTGNQPGELPAGGVSNGPAMQGTAASVGARVKN